MAEPPRETPPRPPDAPSDDPSGGRALTRRLIRVLPVALVVGLAAGVPIAVLSGDWRPAVALPLGLAAVAGTIAAAIEDGRVQRRIDATRATATRSTLRRAREAIARGDEEAAELNVRNALARGARPGDVARELGEPGWDEERVRSLDPAAGTPRSG